MTRPILIIEDDPQWGELIRDSLRRRGFEVDLFIRAEVARRRIQVMDLDGRKQLLRPEQYSTALVDGRLRNSRVDGWELVPILTNGRLKVMAISGCAYFNMLLVRAGAAESILKSALLERIMSNQFHPVSFPSAEKKAG
jgi:DNA-binding response OmpR family regulator